MKKCILCFSACETKLKSIETIFFTKYIFTQKVILQNDPHCTQVKTPDCDAHLHTLALGFAFLWECVTYYLSLLHSVHIDFLFVLPKFGLWSLKLHMVWILPIEWTVHRRVSTLTLPRLESEGCREGKVCKDRSWFTAQVNNLRFKTSQLSLATIFVLNVFHIIPWFIYWLSLIKYNKRLKVDLQG